MPDVSNILPAGIEIPRVDLQDEESAVLSALDAMPPELSARNPGDLVVKITEAMGAFYGMISWQSERIPVRLLIAMARLLGLKPQSASKANAILRFRKSVGPRVTIPMGFRVRNGFGSGSVIFQTTEQIIIPELEEYASVNAAAITPGLVGNVLQNTLTIFVDVLPDLISVTNPGAAIPGEAEETIEQLIAKMPLLVRTVNRAVTGEDFEILSEQFEGIIRAKAVSLVAGYVTVFCVDSQSNTIANPGLENSLREYLRRKSVPGVTVQCSIPAAKQIYVTSVEVEIKDGYSLLTGASPLLPLIEAAANSNFHAETWEFGAPLYKSLIAQSILALPGVKRVGTIFVTTSSDYGATFSLPFEIVDGIPLNTDLADFGVFHVASVAPYPFEVTEL
jgi:uncharacterized phage protein gp47/JayE